MDCKWRSRVNVERSTLNIQLSTTKASFSLNVRRSTPARDSSELDVGRFRYYENRTSLPGSISKSSARKSSVFGLITSSTNFT